MFKDSTEEQPVRRPGKREIKCEENQEPGTEQSQEKGATEQPTKVDSGKKLGKSVLVAYAGFKKLYDDPNHTLETIRKDLEKDFPELSKSRTEMVYEEAKGLVIPIVKAKKGGGR